MKVEVTAEDIRRGARHSWWKCPVAIACRRALNAPVVVGTSGACYFPVKTKIDIDFPESVQKFIARFDAGLPVEPLEFEVAA